jgi:hypothetical protein
LKAAVVTLVLVLGSAAVASAADFCLDLSGTTLVLKGFALPGKGACTVFRGFYSGSDTVVWGNACGTSDNSMVRFGLTSVEPDAFWIIAGFSLDRSSAPPSGTGQFCNRETTCASLGPIVKIPCPPILLD